MVPALQQIRLYGAGVVPELDSNELGVRHGELLLPTVINWSLDNQIIEWWCHENLTYVNYSFKAESHALALEIGKIQDFMGCVIMR